MFFFLINESFDCFLQQMKIGHPVDPDVPEGPDLALAPHHTHDENDPDPSTGKLRTSLNMPFHVNSWKLSSWLLTVKYLKCYQANLVKSN